MMNYFQRITRAFPNFTQMTLPSRAAALVLVLGLFVGAANCRAQLTYYWITNSSDVWQDGNAWTTNGGGGLPVGIWPGESSGSDDARFTNAATYSVTGAPASLNIASNIFENASNTTATVTMELNGNLLGVTANFTVASQSNSTTVVYVDAPGSTTNNPGIRMPPVSPLGEMNIGRAGDGTLILTNGVIDASTVALGSSAGGRGTLVVSGPNSVFSYSEGNAGFSIGTTDSVGNVLIITNGATFGNLINLAHGTFRFGSGSAYANSSNNLVYVGSGGQLKLSTGTISIGNGGTQNPSLGGGPGSFSNLMVIADGGTLDCGGDRTLPGKDGTDHALYLGTAHGNPASNNVLRVLAGGTAHSISYLIITPSNTLDMVGGTIGGILSNLASPQIVLGGTITNWGVVQGYGTFLCNTITGTNTTAMLYLKSSVDSTVFSNSMRVLSNTTLQVELGSSPATTYPTVVASNLELRVGTLNIVAPGGPTSFGNGTYVLFTNLCSTCTTQMTYVPPLTINTPTNIYTYTLGVSTNVSGGGTNALLLTVSGVPIPLPFQITSITRSGNDVTINWNTKGSNGQFNYVQASPGTANGSYPGTFVEIATNTIAGTTASYTDTGGGTNKPARYYRVRSPQ
jgi:hypothetical protein